MSVLETIGKVIAYALCGVLVLVIGAIDLWVLFRYGFFVWLFATPIALGLIWFVFAIVVMAVSALAMGVVALFRRLFGPGAEA